MKFERLSISDVALVTPSVHADERGSFSEVYRAAAFEDAGIGRVFLQANHSVTTRPGTVRGLHFQIPPAPVAKLISVVRGSIFDVSVDIRYGSPSYGKHVAITLSPVRHQRLFVPEGFAHGYLTLEPNTEVVYAVSGYWSPEVDRGLQWDDPRLGIDWPAQPENATVSMKDRAHPALAELPRYFTYEPVR